MVCIVCMYVHILLLWVERTCGLWNGSGGFVFLSVWIANYVCESLLTGYLNTCLGCQWAMVTCHQ